jgi:hypothetical protein
MRGGTPTKFETTAQVRMTRQERRDLDDWRRKHCVLSSHRKQAELVY